MAEQEKTLSQLRRENIQLRAENEKLKMIMNNYRISSEAFAEENYALGTELKMLRAERDAVVKELNALATGHIDSCDICANPCDHVPYMDEFGTCFKWRGVQR